MWITQTMKKLFENVLFISELKSNILSLGELDDQDWKTILQKRFFIIQYSLGRLPTKTHETRKNMYLMKLNIYE